MNSKVIDKSFIFSLILQGTTVLFALIFMICRVLKIFHLLDRFWDIEDFFDPEWGLHMTVELLFTFLTFCGATAMLILILIKKKPFLIGAVIPFVFFNVYALTEFTAGLINDYMDFFIQQKQYVSLCG